MILQNETLLDLTNDTKDGSPPTKIITVKKDMTIDDHNHLLSLAQNKFDEMRQNNRNQRAKSLYSKRGGSILRRNSMENQEEKKISQILSSLLYLSLMMNKVDSIKKILEIKNYALYEEWQVLLDSMHSPTFHLRERRMQNDRVRKLYSRKEKYKMQYEEAIEKVNKLEETANQLSHALSKMSEENLKFLEQLQGKGSLEKDLEIAEMKVKELSTSLQASKEEFKEFKENSVELSSSHSQLEKDISRIEQQYKDETAIREKLQSQLEVLQSTIIEKEKELSKSNVENNHLIEKLKDALESHKGERKKSAQDLVQLKNDNITLQEEVHRLHREHSEAISKLQKAINSLQEDKIQATNEIATLKAQLNSAQDGMVSLRSDLDLKSRALAKALEANKIAQENQAKLQITIGTKHAEIRDVESKLAESKRSLDLDRSASDNRLSELNFDKSKLEEKIASLESKIQQYEVDNVTLKDAESRLQAEKLSLEKDFAELKVKSNAVAAEKKVLEQVVQSMNENVSKARESTDGKLNELENDLLKSRIEVEKGKTEIKELKTSVSLKEKELKEILNAKNVSDAATLKEKEEHEKTKQQYEQSLADITRRGEIEKQLREELSTALEEKNDFIQQKRIADLKIAELEAKYKIEVEKKTTTAEKVVQDVLHEALENSQAQ